MSSIYDLPWELVSEIYSYLMIPKHIISFASTCKYLFELRPKKFLDRRYKYSLIHAQIRCQYTIKSYPQFTMDNRYKYHIDISNTGRCTYFNINKYKLLYGFEEYSDILVCNNKIYVFVYDNRGDIHRRYTVGGTNSQNYYCWLVSKIE